MRSLFTEQTTRLISAENAGTSERTASEKGFRILEVRRPA
jgi:hypothetical protein